MEKPLGWLWYILMPDVLRDQPGNLKLAFLAYLRTEHWASAQVKSQIQEHCKNIGKLPWQKVNQSPRYSYVQSTFGQWRMKWVYCIDNMQNVYAYIHIYSKLCMLLLYINVHYIHAGIYAPQSDESSCTPFLCCLSLASFFLAGMSNSSVMRLYTAQRRKSHLTSH